MPTDKSLAAGLSPRVRGNRHRLPPDAFYAKVYPRVCGGTDAAVKSVAGLMGLSPRVRGNLERRLGQGRQQRSIPACAGEPHCDTYQPTFNAVYPRVCGGTGTACCKSGAGAGLSPRVRGNLHGLITNGNAYRSIPACAGEPPGRCYTRPGRWVYPRVCGGTSGCPLSIRYAEGLSPRVRGNQPNVPQSLLGAGSIPACAGEPAPAAGNGAGRKVYPRVCGGTLPTLQRRRPFCRLSPRVRGNLGVGLGDNAPAGSIPACAGEPTGKSPDALLTGVYPRVCGGT